MTLVSKTEIINLMKSSSRKKNNHLKITLTLLSLNLLFVLSCTEKGTQFQKMDNVNKLSTNREQADNINNDISNDINDVTDNDKTIVVDDGTPTGPFIDAVKISCAEAEKKGSLVEYQTSVFFSESINCKFNEDGNGPRKDRRIRARSEQNYQISLPHKGKVCDIDFNFPEQRMKYDDEIFLLLNNFVLMSSTNYATNSGNQHYLDGLLVNNKGLQTYKWSGTNSLYDLYYGNNVTPKYCYGTNPSSLLYEQDCQIPPTDKFGQIKLNIPKEKIIELGVISDILEQGSSDLTELNFGFVSIGDNDDGDCEHSAFSFDIDIKYYIPYQ